MVKKINMILTDVLICILYFNNVSSTVSVVHMLMRDEI